MDEKQYKEQVSRVRHKDPKTGIVYVLEKHSVYDPKLKNQKTLFTRSIGKILPGTDEIVPCRPKRKSGVAKVKQAAQMLMKSAEDLLEDRRQQAKVVYPFKHVLLVVMLASLAGYTRCTEIASYWERHRETLRKIYPDFPEQNISSDTIRRILSLIDPAQLQSLFETMTRPLIEEYQLRVVAIDGQAVRASKTAKCRAGRYILNAYDAANQLCLEQVLVDEKTNEISHCEELIRRINLHCCVVTCDALNTQVNFARTINERGGNYCMAVKANKHALYEDVRLTFESAPKEMVRSSKSRDEGHGRIETRTTSVLPAASLDLSSRGPWWGLDEGCIVRTESKVTIKQPAEGEPRTRSFVRYFITSMNWSDPAIAEKLSYVIRSHWSVENNLHWVLDVNFDQDRLQCRNADYICNRSLLTKMALNWTVKYQEHLSKTEDRPAPAISELILRSNDPLAGLNLLGCVYGTAS